MYRYFAYTSGVYLRGYCNPRLHLEGKTSICSFPHWRDKRKGLLRSASHPGVLRMRLLASATNGVDRPGCVIDSLNLTPAKSVGGDPPSTDFWSAGLTWQLEV
jgi:hypothetical protein